MGGKRRYLENGEAYNSGGFLGGGVFFGGFWGGSKRKRNCPSKGASSVEEEAREVDYLLRKEVAKKTMSIKLISTTGNRRGFLRLNGKG